MIGFIGRLTPAGKAIFAILLVIVLWTVWGQVKPQQTGPNLTVAAALPTEFPLSDQLFKPFDKQAQTVAGTCPFFEQYSALRGLPIKFTAYIPANAKAQSYYFRDPDTGTEFLPAFHVASDPEGLRRAIAIASGDSEQLEDCAAGFGAEGRILLGFPEGTSPTSRLISVWGSLWWSSDFVNPRQFETEAGRENGVAPTIMVGRHKPSSPSQLSNPPIDSRVLNVAVQAGPGIIRVGRIEYSDRQTRLWIELINKGSIPLPAWEGRNQATLREEGGSRLSPGAENPGEVGEEGEEEGPGETADGLPGDVIPPGGKLSGYLFFPRVDLSKKLELTFPEIGDPRAEFNGRPSTLNPPMVLTIPASPKASR